MLHRAISPRENKAPHFDYKGCWPHGHIRAPRQFKSQRRRRLVLFLAQRAHGIDGGSSARRNQRRSQHQQQNQHNRQRHRYRIERANAKEQCLEQARRSEGSCKPQHAAHRGQLRAGSQNQAHHPRGLCALSHANRHLLHAQRDCKCDDAINTENRQQNGGGGESGDKERVEFP